MKAIEKAAARYDTDVHAWATEQAQLLRQKRFESLDIDNLAEEIESVGRSERRAVQSFMELILVHLACLQFSPAIEPREHWIGEVRNFRRRLEREFRDSPSLKPMLFEDLEMAWSLARWEALKKLQRDGIQTLPDRCPFNPSQLRSPEFLPCPEPDR